MVIGFQRTLAGYGFLRGCNVDELVTQHHVHDLFMVNFPDISIWLDHHHPEAIGSTFEFIEFIFECINDRNHIFFPMLGQCFVE